ncbi:MAG: uracil-DNA glycosylase family protein, partial [Thermodesulfobacteriota bacterium]
MESNDSYLQILEDASNYITALKDFGLESVIFDKDTPELLNYQIQRCTFCGSGSKKYKRTGLYSFPDKIKVLFVVDMPKNPDEDRIFSGNERVLFKKILAAMNLKIDEVFVIPAVRCSTDKIKNQEILNDFSSYPCSGFFERIVNLTNPSSICLLGKEEMETAVKNKSENIQGHLYFQSRYRLFLTRSLEDMISNPELKK